jgi:hypothetical protein
VKLGGRKVQMAVSELPASLQKAIPEEWHGEPVRGSVNLYINIPDAEREEGYRFTAKE